MNDSLIQVDTISLHIPPEEKFTKDSVKMCVDDVVCHQVQNVTQFRMPPWQTSLMRMQAPDFDTKKLSQVLPDREDFGHNMPCALDDATDAWGTEIECEEIRNANSSVQLPRATGSEAKVSHRVQGKAGAAQKEMAAS